MQTFREFLIAENMEARTVVITYDPDWEEYTVPSPDGKPAGTAHTDDKQDAVDTAKHMYGQNVIIKMKRKRLR